MYIHYSPVRSDSPIESSRSGDVMTLGGMRVDLSMVTALSEVDASRYNCPWIVGKVSRSATGELSITLVAPHGPNAPEETRFPSSVRVSGGGPVPYPDFGPASMDGSAS